MRTICYNQQQLNILTADMYNRFAEYGCLAVDYDKPYKAHTLKQTGFFFGCIVAAIKEFYKQQGDDMDDLTIRENLYNACSLLEPSLKRKIRRFNGAEVEVPLRLSEMDIEQASVFIDACIRLIDNARCFSGLVLHPSVRYTWIRRLTDDDIRQAQAVRLPRVDAEYLEHTRKQACLVCGICGKTQVHHLKESGVTGVAYKADDWCCIPLCSSHHHQYHCGKLILTESLGWIEKYVDIVSFCKLRYLRWKNHL